MSWIVTLEGGMKETEGGGRDEMRDIRGQLGDKGVRGGLMTGMNTWIHENIESLTEGDGEGNQIENRV